MNSSVKIGQMEQVFNTTVMAKNNEVIEIIAPLFENRQIGQQFIRLEVIFKEADKDPGSGSFFAIEGGVRFIFEGWNNSLGHATNSPIKFGEIENRKMHLSVVSHFVGQVNVCTLAILLGAPNA